MGRGFLFIVKAMVNFMSCYSNCLLQVNQVENAIWKMIKEVLHVCEKRFFTDEILNFSKTTLGSASCWWSMATVFAGNKELSWHN